MFGIKNKTIEVGIKITIGIAVLLLIHFFGGKRVFDLLKKERKRAISLQKELKDKKDKLKAHPNPRKEIEIIKQDMLKLKEKAVSEKELPRIIQQLTKKSSEMDIEIISIRPIRQVPFKEEDLPQGVSKAYIEVVLKVAYKTLGEYLKELKGLPTIFTIEGISMERYESLEEDDSRQAEEGGKLIVTLLISSYTVWQI